MADMYETYHIKREDLDRKNHPGWKLSRGCIGSMILAKRKGLFHVDPSDRNIAMGLALYPITIRNLRDTQLRPHTETAMIAGRYRMKQKIKGAPGDLCDICGAKVIFGAYIRHADSPPVSRLIDNDYCLCDDCLESLLNDLTQEPPTAQVVYIDADGNLAWIASPKDGATTYLVADFYSMKYGDAEEIRSFLYSYMVAALPGMEKLPRSYPWAG